MDIRSQRTVSGFMRKNLKIHTSRIFDEILHVCLRFYYSVQDSFSESERGSDIAPNVFNKLVEWKQFVEDFTRIINVGKEPSKYNTAYGIRSINPFECRVHKWKMKVHRSNGDCYVGIDSLWNPMTQMTRSLDSTFVSAYYEQQLYAVSSNGSKYSHYAHGKEQSDIEFTSGDKLAMIFDCSGEYGSLSLSVNGDPYERIFHMIPKSRVNPHFRLAVSLPGGSYFELINYAYSDEGSLLNLYDD